jgi:hypothetical protein
VSSRVFRSSDSEPGVPWVAFSSDAYQSVLPGRTLTNLCYKTDEYFDPSSNIHDYVYWSLLSERSEAVATGSGPFPPPESRRLEAYPVKKRKGEGFELI